MFSYRVLLLKAKLKLPPSFSSKHCSYFLRVQQYKCRSDVRHCNVKIGKSLVLPACCLFAVPKNLATTTGSYLYVLT